MDEQAPLTYDQWRGERRLIDWQIRKLRQPHRVAIADRIRWLREKARADRLASELRSLEDKVEGLARVIKEMAE